MTASGARAPRATVALTLAALATSLAACASPGPSAEGGTRTLTVLAAASLTDVFEKLAEDFEADNPGVTVEQSYAASSTIVQQVNEGAPADVVALAGQRSLDPLDPELRASPPVVFTTNTLALAVPADNPAGIDGPEDLTQDGIRLVACQPEVPCGAAARTLFEHLAISPDVASFEPDVRATLSKVELGEADVGVVYRTDVAAGGGVVGVEIPPADNVVSSYPVLAVSGSPLAQGFIDEVMSERGQQRLADAGFGAP